MKNNIYVCLLVMASTNISFGQNSSCQLKLKTIELLSSEREMIRISSPTLVESEKVNYVNVIQELETNWDISNGSKESWAAHFSELENEKFGNTTDECINLEWPVKPKSTYNEELFLRECNLIISNIIFFKSYALIAARIGTVPANYDVFETELFLFRKNKCGHWEFFKQRSLGLNKSSISTEPINLDNDLDWGIE